MDRDLCMTCCFYDEEKDTCAKSWEVDDGVEKLREWPGLFGEHGRKCKRCDDYEERGAEKE